MSEAFLKVVNMSISAGWLVLAVLVLRILLKKAPKWVNVLLWGIVAVRLICPFSMESALSLIPSPETISPEIMMDRTPEISTGIESIDRVVNPVISASFAPVPYASANPLQILIPVAANFWLLGVILLLVYTAVSYLSLGLKLRTAVILKDNIFQCETVNSPFVLGILRPKIYLPYTMDGQNLYHVVAHEQAHICRRDHWWKPLGFLLLTLYWFNPLMWVAYILLCRDIELACDEKVIKELGNEQRADYTQALVACSVNRRSIAACPLAFGEVSVKERVKSVMNYKKPGFWVVVLAVFACAAVAVCFLTNPAESTIYDIFAENGYEVIGQGETDITLHIDKSKLPDSIYTAQGCEFKPDEVVAYSTETSRIYLHKAVISNESDERLYLIFDFFYDLPKTGSVISPYKFTGEQDGMQSNLYLRSRDLKDESTVYPDALDIRGYGPGNQFALYVDKTACDLAQNTLIIDIVCNEIVYEEEHGHKSQRDSSSQVTKWFDYLIAPEEMHWDGRLEMNLPEFPDVTFRWYPEKMEAVTGGKIIPLYTGMPIWNTYFCDLTGDGLPELCSTYAFGSGIIDSRVILYDYANGVSYMLEDRGYHDYYLRMEDACLYVDKRVYGSDELVSSGRLVFKDGCIQIEGVDTSPTNILQAQVLEIHDGYYLVEPVEGSWELSSADRIEIPMKNMATSPEPQVGDILEIEYDGILQETYPARIGAVYSIRVISERPYITEALTLREVAELVKEQQTITFVGMAREAVHGYWGEPDAQVHGFFGDIYHVPDSSESLIFRYSDDETVERVMIENRNAPDTEPEEYRTGSAYEPMGVSGDNVTELSKVPYDVTWQDGLGFSDLAPGGEIVSDYEIIVEEDGSQMLLMITWAGQNLILEYGIRAEDGTEYSLEKAGGAAFLRIEDLPSGKYLLYVKNCDRYQGIPAYENPELFTDVSFNATGAALYTLNSES